MNKIPITFCLFTTTKGHFGKNGHFLRTVESFNRALPLSEYEDRIAHVKVSPGESAVGQAMVDHLDEMGFQTTRTTGEWSHGTDSHSLGYIQDYIKVCTLVKTPYVLNAEDDWLLATDDFEKQIAQSLHYFDDPDLMQVRIPRYTDELNRINGLKMKHNLDRSAVAVDSNHFRHDDFSANPAFYRTRDVRAAAILTLKTNLPKHIEHGVGEALRLLSNARHPFACLNPENARIGHIGVRTPAEEDDLSKPLLA